MSTDLEIRQELPQLRLPTIRIVVDVSDDECHTPTSAEHTIPPILSCPPAPKKPRRSAASCKRKLSELDFFEVVAREEVESFFAAANLSSVLKRRCPCTWLIWSLHIYEMYRYRIRYEILWSGYLWYFHFRSRQLCNSRNCRFIRVDFLYNNSVFAARSGYTVVFVAAC